MKKLLIATVLGAALLSVSMAQAAPGKKPKKCPSVAAIQAVGIQVVKQEDGYWLGGSENNKFGTKDTWSFAVLLDEATDEADARTRTTQGLSSLTFQGGPEDEGQSGWVCFYQTSEGYMAGAVTPAMPLLKTAKSVR